MFELHDFERSSAAWRVRIALALKGITHDLVPIDINAGEQFDADYRALNPQGLVPTWSDEHLTLSQSLAIIEYLEERFPEPPLLPANIVARARARQLALLVATDVHPLNVNRVHHYLRDALRLSDAQRRAWLQHWLIEGLDAVELWLTATGARSFCVGDSPTVADICLVPQLELARRNQVSLDDFPSVLAIEARCLELDAFMKTAPDGHT